MNLSRNTLIIIGALAAVLVVGLAGLQVRSYMAEQKAMEEARLAEEARLLAEEKKFRQDFESILNAMLQNVRFKMQSYKEQRQVLRELVRPANLSSAAYVEENYRLMQGAILSLKSDMDTVMLIFEQADKDLRDLIVGRPLEWQAAVLAEWQALKEKHARPYVAFFASEGTILDTYRKLMEFYYLKQGAFVVDAESNAALFNNPEDKAQEQEYINSIAEFTAQQAEVLQENPE